MAQSKTGEVLFELPVRGDKDLGVGGSGKIVCTQPRPQIYLVTFTNEPDNRLVTVRKNPPPLLSNGLSIYKIIRI